MKIGITGGTGVLGMIFQKKLLAKAIDFECFQGDITKREEVLDWIKNGGYTAIIHLAAFVPINLVNQNPSYAYSVNIGGVINLVEAIENAKQSPWFFYASTSHVYNSSTSPIDEECEINPINTYGFTKRLGEQVLLDYAGLRGLKLCIGRIFSFYHETQKPPFLYPSIMHRLKTEDLGKPFKLHGANSIRDIINAEDVCDMILNILEKQLVGIFNIGSGVGIKIKEFVQSLSPMQLNFLINNQEPVNYLVANTKKLKLALANE